VFLKKKVITIQFRQTRNPYTRENIPYYCGERVHIYIRLCVCEQDEKKEITLNKQNQNKQNKNNIKE
jgi:hypothetical protein